MNNAHEKNNHCFSLKTFHCYCKSLCSYLLCTHIGIYVTLFYVFSLTAAALNCEVGNSSVSDGQVVSMNDCRECRCKDGMIACSGISCQTPACEWSVLLPGKCCPECQGMDLTHSLPLTFHCSIKMLSTMINIDSKINTNNNNKSNNKLNELLKN